MAQSTDALEEYYRLVKTTILDRQNPVTGLLPSSLICGKFVPGKSCSDSWIRDNVYTSFALWALSLAYKKRSDFDEDKLKHYELEQSVVKLMRGILQCMMQQVDKVESFKKTQKQDDSLHAKYSYSTGHTVVGDNNWGHLQIDAVSLYLLALGQMTASGILLIYSKAEVDFIQNLVFYIETAYRISDFGIFERGDKTNRGIRELNASSVGMAKAALEAMNELDVFGSLGGSGSIIHVQADQVQYCKAVLHSMLPRESYSKECSSSLLSIISFPAFAVEDPAIIESTKAEIVNRLQGKYGCKRFLRDGHSCANEDKERLHYEMHELSKFENIECEWPLFFCFLLIDGVFNDNVEQVNEYLELLKPLLIKTEGDMHILPQLYYVPADKIKAERAHPHSQERISSDYIPHFWTHSLYIVGRLLAEGFVAPGELDPLSRRYVSAPKPELVVQISLIAEDEQVKQLLKSHGVTSHTVDEVKPIQVLPAQCLSWIFGRLGKNKKLGLSGRPRSTMGIVNISSLYRVGGNIYAFTPQFFDYHQFYLCLDNELLVDQFKTNIEYLRNNWCQLGRPTLAMPVTHSLLQGSMDSAIGKILLQISSGYLYSVRIRIGKLSDIISRASVKQLDFVDPDDLEDLSRQFPNPSASPKPGDVLRHISTEQKISTTLNQNSSSQCSNKSIQGSLLRSISLSRVSSWGTSASSGSDYGDDDLSLDLIQNFVKKDDAESEIDVEEIRSQLENTDNINEQADILHYLYTTKGYQFDVKLYGIEGCTVKKLLEELYVKACHLKLWSILRHTSGMLGKGVTSIDQTCTELLVNQKQIGIGLPHLQREEVIKQPLPPAEIKKFIYCAYGEDSSSAVLTQELLVYLAMFMKTEPNLFKEMLRIRVGLIMEVLAAEYARATGYSGEEVASHLMALSPIQMKSLLYYILSGKEFASEDIENQSRHTLSRKSCLERMKTVTSEISEKWHSISEDTSDSEPTDTKSGSWLRRRCLDGALNRVPAGFYIKIWHILQRCQGFCVTTTGMMLEQKLTNENTSGELKFALKVEEELNKVVYPEYRQLVVETMMLFYMFLEHDPKYEVKYIVKLDEIVKSANGFFLEHQKQHDGDALLCCAGERTGKCHTTTDICRFFYDSAPSGTFGTMTYLTQAILHVLYGHLEDSNEVMRLS